MGFEKFVVWWQPAESMQVVGRERCGSQMGPIGCPGTSVRN